MDAAASRTSQSQACGSRSINQFPRTVDARQHVRVAHAARLHQVNTATKQFLQLGFQRKVAVQAALGRWRKLDQKISITACRLKVGAARSRTKDFELLNAQAFADVRDLDALLVDQGVHGRVMVSGARGKLPCQHARLGRRSPHLAMHHA